MKAHSYDSRFYTYINEGANQSAVHLFSLLFKYLNPRSILDLGCGTGAWLSAAKTIRPCEVQGIDGDYIETQQLCIDPEEFTAADLTKELNLNRSFDLALSLEVGEHLPPTASEILVKSLTTHSDIVLFSAAPPGQCGEFHINERPIKDWMALFSDRGYSPYDLIYANLANEKGMKPWYRYNVILYVKDSIATQLPDEILSTRISPTISPKRCFPLQWKLRLTLGRILPTRVSTAVAQLLSRITRQ